MKQLLKSFRSNENGNFAVLASIMILPILLLVGVGIDYSRISSVDGKLQSSVDNAALSAVKIRGSDSARRQMILANISANHSDDNLDVQVTVDDTGINVIALQTINTPMLSLIGQPQTTIETSTELKRKRITPSNGDITDSSPINSNNSTRSLKNNEITDKQIRYIKQGLKRQLARMKKSRRLTFQQRLRIERQIKRQIRQLEQLR